MTPSNHASDPEDRQALLDKFHQLAVDGDVDGLRLLLPLFIGTPLFASGFSRASCSGHLESIELFLPYAAPDQLATAAFHAASNGRCACLRRLAAILAEAGHAESFARNVGEDSAMGIAAARGHAECVAILLDIAGAGDESLALPKAWEALSTSGGASIISAPEQAIASLAFRGLRAACSDGHLACVALLSPLCSPEKNSAALIAAARGGHVECVRFLAERAKRSFTYLSFALESSAQHGHRECVEILWPLMRQLPTHPTLEALAADARLRGFHAAATLMEALSERDTLSELPASISRGSQRI